MKKYLVKQVSVATEDNPNFAGQVSISFYGKDQKQLSHSGSHAEATHTMQGLFDWNIRDYGYNRACDARRSWVYKNPENSKFWKSSVEVVCVDWLG